MYFRFIFHGENIDFYPFSILMPRVPAACRTKAADSGLFRPAIDGFA